MIFIFWILWFLGYLYQIVNMDTSASINSNAVVNYNGMDAHKKALFGHNSSDLDSGYAENFSMSHATGSTSGLSSSAKYTSMSSKRSLDLETISENNEQKGKIFDYLELQL